MWLTLVALFVGVLWLFRRGLRMRENEIQHRADLLYAQAKRSADEYIDDVQRRISQFHVEQHARELEHRHRIQELRHAIATKNWETVKQIMEWNDDKPPTQEITHEILVTEVHLPTLPRHV
jgi:galactokinase/mevalonate kinase-like predicted kinase